MQHSALERSTTWCFVYYECGVWVLEIAWSISVVQWSDVCVCVCVCVCEWVAWESGLVVVQGCLSAWARRGLSTGDVNRFIWKIKKKVFLMVATYRGGGCGGELQESFSIAFGKAICVYNWWINWKRFEINKKVWKWLKKVFQPAFGCAQHPKAGWNTQQIQKYFHQFLCLFWLFLHCFNAKNWDGFSEWNPFKGCCQMISSSSRLPNDMALLMPMFLFLPITAKWLLHSCYAHQNIWVISSSLTFVPMFDKKHDVRSFTGGWHGKKPTL